MFLDLTASQVLFEPREGPFARVASAVRDRSHSHGRLPFESFIDEVLAGLKVPDAASSDRAGIAYGLHRLAAAREDKNLAAIAELWIAGAPSAPATLAVRALLDWGRGDVGAFEASTERYLAAIDRLGRSGIRMLCQLLAASRNICASTPRSILDAGIRQVSGLWSGLASQPSIGDPGGLTDLGAAHGWAGALYAVLQWSVHSGEALPAGFEDRLDQLASFGAKTAAGIHWPNRVQGSFENRGWCTGGAGYVLLWTLAHSALAEPRWLRLAEESARDNAAHLGGEAGLCCGLAGQAFAQLALYRHTGELEWLRNAHVLAAAAVERVRSGGARHTSLHQGAVGVAVLAAELPNPTRAAMPLVETQPFVRKLAL